METRARYAVIGAFVLIVILGAFGFVYWLQNTGGLGERATYRVEFDQPVSGLTAGSGVLFNGLHVGAIQSLGLDPDNPSGLVATISIDPSTPIHADTKVDISFQGLTGSPAILLHGGTANSPRLTAANGKIPVLVASGDVGKNLSDSARDTLAHIDQVIAENSKPLHNAITGISTFADMLGRNSKKIEAMLGGLEKMLGVGGGEKQTAKVYDLAAATDFPKLDKKIEQQMSVADPHAILAFDTQKILIRSKAGTYSEVENARWADNLPKLMQARIVESFANAHQLNAVSRPYDQLEAAYRIELDIRDFQIVPEPKPQAVVSFAARILSGDKGKVIDARLFSASAPAKSAQAADAVAAFDDAFVQATTQLVVWTVDKITAAPPVDESMEKGDNEFDKPGGGQRKAAPGLDRSGANAGKGAPLPPMSSPGLTR
ncbi:MAG TPA: ABC-type transport auxiliary lipoprotein family protein [Pseudolabrys sp.]|nr:ABC-type transport auxiliary lipoprotein family protein [Pseudolabrys sp.]